MLTVRGEIQHRERAAQLCDFSGLKFGDTWTPTDVDLFMEVRDTVFVFGELKSGDAPLHYGQQTALTRLTDAIAETGRHSMFFIARHDVPVWQDVDAAAAIVERLRFKKRWYPGNGATAYEIIARFFARFLDADVYTGADGDNAGRGDTLPGGQTNGLRRAIPAQDAPQVKGGEHDAK